MHLLCTIIDHAHFVKSTGFEQFLPGQQTENTYIAADQNFKDVLSRLQEKFRMRQFSKTLDSSKSVGVMPAWKKHEISTCP